MVEARACLEKLGKAVPASWKKTPPTDVERLLEVCAAHFAANRLTTGVGGTAVECYRKVQSLDPANMVAVEGLQRVFDKYAAWAGAALEKGDTDKARSYVEKLQGLAPEAPEVAELGSGIARLEKEAAEARGKAERERKEREERKRAEAASPAKLLEEARDILSRAWQAAQRVEIEFSRAGAFRNIAEAQAKAGDTQGAAQSISDAIRYSCSTSSATWRDVPCAPVMFTVPTDGGMFWSRW